MKKAYQLSITFNLLYLIGISLFIDYTVSKIGTSTNEINLIVSVILIIIGLVASLFAVKNLTSIKFRVKQQAIINKYFKLHKLIINAIIYLIVLVVVVTCIFGITTEILKLTNSNF